MKRKKKTIEDPGYLQISPENSEPRGMSIEHECRDEFHRVVNSGLNIIFNKNHNSFLIITSQHKFYVLKPKFWILNGVILSSLLTHF